MKTKLLIIVLTLSVTNSYAQNKRDIIGKWIQMNGESGIEIFQKGEKFFGKIIWIKDPNQPNGSPKTDIRNPDVRFRKRSILGLILITDLIYTNGKWIDGKIYSPKDGIYADCSIALQNENELKVTILKSIFKTTKIWKRL
jgi:uncharacterized protein (DUF2147 family)